MDTYVFSEGEGHFFSFKQLLLLEDQIEFGLFKDSNELSFADGGKVDSDRQPSQQFWNEILDLSHGERAAGNKENVVCFDISKFGWHGGSLDERQQITLHTLSRNSLSHVAQRPISNSQFVDFIQKDNPVFLYHFNSLPLDIQTG